MTIWICERCPGEVLHYVFGPEEALLRDVEVHRLAEHRDVPGASVWIEHDDWERLANDWDLCPACHSPVVVAPVLQQWQCSDPSCTLGSSDSGQGYPLSALQLVGP